MQDVKTVLMCAPRFSKSRRILGVQEFTTNQATKSLFKTPSIVGETVYILCMPYLLSISHILTICNIPTECVAAISSEQYDGFSILGFVFY
jgi:hypothetical protein